MSARRQPTAAICWLVAAIGGLSAACSDKAVMSLFPPGEGGSGGATTTISATTSVTSSTGGSSTSNSGGGGNSCAPGFRISTSELSLPSEAVPSDEYHPVPLAARADGSSLLAYRDASQTLIRVVAVDQNDVVSETLFETPAEEVHALMAHDDGGGAVVFVREDIDISIPEICQPECSSMELVRFDDAGEVSMSATLTDKLMVNEEGALFVFWYEHTARIAWADDTYGVYFRSARTIPQPTGLGPRPGDTLRFVDDTGARLERGWDFGCIPSWSVRLLHNGVWAAVCHGDTPNAHRFVVLDGDEQRQLLLLDGVRPSHRALGGLTAQGDDFWLSYLARFGDDVELHLARITSTPEIIVDRVLPEAVDLDFRDDTSVYLYRAYHAKLGDDLLLGWKSHDQLVLAVADGETGAITHGPFRTDAPIDHFVEFVSFPNGDVAWANAAASGLVTLTRVSPCE